MDLFQHVSKFSFRSIANPKIVNTTHRFPSFWKAVGILEDKCKLKFMVVISACRTVYRMHKGVKHFSVSYHEEQYIRQKNDKNWLPGNDCSFFVICD